MQAKAIEKLQSEMTQNKANSYIQVVGCFLLQHLESNPQDAERILIEDKSIGKSLEEMRKEASKKKTGSCAVLTDQEGFAVVLKYFGIVSGPVIIIPSEFRPPTPPAPVEPKPTTNDFDINLDDFL